MPRYALVLENEIIQFQTMTPDEFRAACQRTAVSENGSYWVEVPQGLTYEQVKNAGEHKQNGTIVQNQNTEKGTSVMQILTLSDWTPLTETPRGELWRNRTTGQFLIIPAEHEIAAREGRPVPTLEATPEEIDWWNTERQTLNEAHDNAPGEIADLTAHDVAVATRELVEDACKSADWHFATAVELVAEKLCITRIAAERLVQQSFDCATR